MTMARAKRSEDKVTRSKSVKKPLLQEAPPAPPKAAGPVAPPPGIRKTRFAKEIVAIAEKGELL
jgi:hypothetical protein